MQKHNGIGRRVEVQDVRATVHFLATFDTFEDKLCIAQHDEELLGSERPSAFWGVME